MRRRRHGHCHFSAVFIDHLPLFISGGWQRVPAGSSGPGFGAVGIARLGATKNPRRSFWDRRGFSLGAGGDLLSRGRSIIGPAGLTTVFGMGTGVALRVWPPAKPLSDLSAAERVLISCLMRSAEETALQPASPGSRSKHLFRSSGESLFLTTDSPCHLRPFCLAAGYAADFKLFVAENLPCAS